MTSSSARSFVRSLWIAALAAALFVPLFVVRAIGPFDFWWWMSANIMILMGLGAALDSGYLPAVRRDLAAGIFRKIALGILSAFVLYGVFALGNQAARAVWPSAGTDIGRVYGFKAGVSPVRILLLLILLIGPGEEIFWRGFLQRNWMERCGRLRGLVAAASFYALVHAATGNWMLVLAAAAAGLFWGFLYMRTGSLLLVAVSHTLWDAAIFVLLPLA